MANIKFEEILSQIKQKIANLNLKDKWSKFKLTLDKIPVPKWLLVIITSISLVVAIVSLISLLSSGSNTKISTDTDTNINVPAPKEETINGLVPGVEYVASVDGWNIRLTLYEDGSAYSPWSGDCEWFFKSIKGQKFVVVEPLDASTSGAYYIDKNQKLYLNSVNSQGYKMTRSKK